jgi:hypothetical protein
MKKKIIKLSIITVVLYGHVISSCGRTTGSINDTTIPSQLKTTYIAQPFTYGQASTSNNGYNAVASFGEVSEQKTSNNNYNSKIFFY